MLTALRLAWVVLLLSAAALAGYSSERAVDGVAHEQYNLRARQVQAADVRLNERLLTARLGLLARYDPLVDCINEVDALHVALADVPKFLPASARSEIVARVHSSTETHAQKQQIIEQFKTEHAILRNSMRFFPLAAKDLLGRARAASAAQPLAADLEALLGDVLLLNMVPEREIAARISQRVQAARASAAAAPELQGDLALVLAHASVIATRKLDVDELVARIVRLPTGARMRAVELRYSEETQRAMNAASSRRAALFTLALLGIAFGALEIIVRMSRSAAALRDAKQDLEAANQSLRHERERERELSDAKSRLLSLLSHEFRTPLTVVLSSAELLEAYGDRWPAEKRVEHASRIRTAVKRVSKMIETILAFNRTDAGQIEFKPVATGLRALCDELIEDARSYARPGQSVALSIEDDAPETVVLDPALLRHGLSNLLFNGLKYSPDGGEVCMHVWSEGGSVHFEIEDTGIGIAPEDIERLFNQYFRGKNVGGIPGTGLGLALVKRVVERHQGTISVASELNVGSRFTVSIPEVLP
ncbi:MAG: DAHL domain-containing protein [Polyangiales bacterium]